MAKNVLSLQLLRNSTLFNDKAAAIAGITSASTQDGVIKLARYTEGEGAQATTKTIFGIYHAFGNDTGYTIYDSYQEVIEAMQTQINAISAATSGAGITLKDVEDMLGDGVGTGTGESVTDQLEALSGTTGASSAETSVAGAKAYTDDKIATLDYAGATTGDGKVVVNVTEADGIVAASTSEVGSLKLTEYSKGVDATAVANTDTVNQAISKLENQIDNVSSASTSGVTEINAKLGTGVTTANTATAQFAALSGDSATAQSGDTSVEGAKKYADAKIGQAVSGLDYTDTAVTGQYVSAVNEVDGVIAVTRASLPSVTDTAVAKNFITEVDQTNGEISVSRGEITSTDKTITLTDGNDGGIDFAVNIDNSTIVKDANTGVLSVANSALVEYIGDEDTIDVSTAVNNQKTISSLLSIKEVTTSVPDTVAHRYMLAGTGTTKIGEYIDIPKDSALANFYLGHVDDVLTDADPTTHESPTSTVTPGTGDTALVWIMQLSNGNYKLATVDVHSFIDEAEFASGVTWDSTAKKVKGVVDGTSESFLTVGADGFKLSGVQAAIDNAVSGATAQTAALSAKTVTVVTSSNNSISTASTAAADGTVSVDLVTDASKVKMTGWTADASGFTAITTASTVTEAVKVIETEFLANEATVSAALNDLEEDKLENIVVNGVSGTVANQTATVTIDGADITLDGYQKPAAAAAITSADTVNQAIGKLEKGLEAATSGGITGATVNNAHLAVTNKVLTQTVAGKQTEATATSNEAIVVETDANGNLTLGLAYLDAGTY